MDLPNKALIDVLTYLLPGFVAAATVYVLTPAIRPAPFERVVQALIYTIVVQALVVVCRFLLLGIGSRCCRMGTWTSDAALVWSMVLAVAVGLVTAWANNTDCVHAVLRRVGITHQTSFSSEWYGAFAQNDGYIVLHIAGQRRLYGWAEEWPSTPEKGHFVVTQAEWLIDNGPSVPLTGVERILIRGEDVEMVEMMKVDKTKTEDNDGRQKGTDSPTAAADPG